MNLISQWHKGMSLCLSTLVVSLRRHACVACMWDVGRSSGWRCSQCHYMWQQHGTHNPHPPDAVGPSPAPTRWLGASVAWLSAPAPPSFVAASLLAPLLHGRPRLLRDPSPGGSCIHKIVCVRVCACVCACMRMRAVSACKLALTETSTDARSKTVLQLE